MGGERVLEPGVDGDRILPVLGDFKGLDDVHALVEFGIDEPLARRKPPETAGSERRLVHRALQKGDLPLGKIGVIRPFHELVPHLGIVLLVEVDLVVEEGEPLQRGHRAEDIPPPVEDAHEALFVDVLGRLFVEPDEIERTPLKLFPALIAALEADDARAALLVPDDDLIDDARGRAVLPAAEHDDIDDLIGAEIGEDLLLRDVALHLLGERDHPAEDVLPVLPVGMHAARHPHRLHRAALRLARTVAPEHPAVALFALVERHLLFVHAAAFVVAGEPVGSRPLFLLRLDGGDHVDDFVHIRQNLPYPAPRFAL